MAAQLNALSPLNVLSRGYALCMDDNGAVVRNIEQTAIGDTVTVLLECGSLKGTVTSKEEHKWNS